MKLPQNPTIAWLRKTMRELGLNHDRVMDNMCFPELVEAYPEYVGIACSLIEKSEGPRALYAYKIFRAGGQNIEWLKEIIKTDECTDDGLRLSILHRVEMLDLELAGMYEEIKKQFTDDEIAQILSFSFGSV